MNTYFKVIEDIKTALIAEPFINNVSQGDLFEIDLNKKTIFPLAHIIIDNIDIQTNSNLIKKNILIIFINSMSIEVFCILIIYIILFV